MGTDMNYSKHQILAFTGHRDKYVKALAAIAEDFVTRYATTFAVFS